MRPFATDVARSVIYVCVLGTVVSSAVQKRLNRSRCRLRNWLVRPKEPCIRWGSRSQREGQFWGLSCPLNNIGSLYRGVRSKRDHSTVSNGMTARLLQTTAVLPIVCMIVVVIRLMLQYRLTWSGKRQAAVGLQFNS